MPIKIPQNKRTALIFIGVAALLLLPLILFTRLSGARDLGRQSVLQQAFENLVEAETMHVQTNLELSLPPMQGNQERPITGVSVNVDGDVLYDNTTPLFDGTLYLEARGRGMQLFTHGKLRILSDVVAFKLDNLPALLNPDGNLVGQWTHVDASALETKNPDMVHESLSRVLQDLSYKDNIEVPDTKRNIHRYSLDLTEEHARDLHRVFRYSVSGNQGLHVIARLLQAFDTGSIEVLVDNAKSEIRMIRFEFSNSNDTNHSASLAISLSDYGKEVSVERPDRELSVRSEVFSALFDEGDFGELDEVLD